MGCSKQFARAAEMFIFYNFEMLEFNMALQKICKHQKISLLVKENINNLFICLTCIIKTFFMAQNNGYFFNSNIPWIILLLMALLKTF